MYVNIYTCQYFTVLLMCLLLLRSEELNVTMSGIKRTIKETDPDYEDVSVALPNKRHKAIESSGRH